MVSVKSSHPLPPLLLIELATRDPKMLLGVFRTLLRGHLSSGMATTVQTGFSYGQFMHQWGKLVPLLEREKEREREREREGGIYIYIY
jgi:hypothetical protein